MQETQLSPWVRKIPWRRAWLPAPVFWAGEFHGRGDWRTTVHGGLKESDTTKRLMLYPISPGYISIYLIQFSSVAQSCSTLCEPMDCSTRLPCPSPTSQSLLKLMSIKSVMSSNNFILSCPLLLLPSIFPSTRVFSKESVLYLRWPKYWSFNLNISPSDEYSGLISFRMDWLDILAVQETLKHLLQHHSSKGSILWCSAFFIFQLSHQYMTTRKTISSVQFSHSDVSNSLRPHESQHARPPCPSPTPRVHSDSHLLSQWCHPAISSSVVPFSSWPQSLPASEFFPMSQLFAWGGQSTGVSALA